MLRTMVNAQLNQVGYSPHSCNAIIRTEHTGRTTTNCHVQYFRSFKLWWFSRTVRGCRRSIYKIVNIMTSLTSYTYANFLWVDQIHSPQNFSTTQSVQTAEASHTWKSVIGKDCRSKPYLSFLFPIVLLSGLSTDGSIPYIFFGHLWCNSCIPLLLLSIILLLAYKKNISII